MRMLLSILALVGCAKAGDHARADAGGDQPTDDAGCGELCDTDGDGVLDPSDACPGTIKNQPVNHVGCSDAQLEPALVEFPPFGLTWTPTGDLGRAGGLTWTYVGIDRADLFHIYWVVCDDPATPCGVSLDGPIDAPEEAWQFDALGSDFLNGKIAFTNTTKIALADGTTPTLAGRLTLTITDAGAPVRCADSATMQVPARTGGYGAEIKGTAFDVVALVEVQDPMTLAWSPYLDYYDAAPTPETGGSTAISFGGSFYAK